MNSPAILIATLGAEPQVITLTLDCLMKMNEHITGIVVLHTESDHPTMRHSLESVRRELDTYASRLNVRFTPFSLDERPIADVTREDEAVAVLRTLYTEVATLKASDHHIHLCPAGGRKAMSMYAMLVAQLLFEPDDRLWMLLSTEPLRLDRRFHARMGEASLLRVPVLPWHIQLNQKRIFLEEILTEAQSQIVEMIARHALKDKEIARRRGTSPKTISAQLTEIYERLRQFTDYPYVDRHTLVAEFGDYYKATDALDAPHREDS